MADALYPKAKAQLMIGAIDLRAVTIHALLLNALSEGDYTYNASHEFLSDIPGGARIKASNPLSGKTVNLTTARFDSDDPTVEAVAGGGDDVSRLVLYIDGVNDAARRLLFYKDSGITTVPFTPDGSDIRLIVHANGWFGL
jgi:hypothetical protein